MATKKNNGLESLRTAAQYFTMAAAVLAGIVWVVSMTGWDPQVGDMSSIDILMRIFVKATMIGGVVMGLLYLVKLLKKN